MKIYTGRGDRGKTSLFGGVSVDKDSPRVVAYGSVDEVSAVLGMALSLNCTQENRTILSSLQRQLFKVGADLATRVTDKVKLERIREEDWRGLEVLIDRLDRQLPALRNFIVPGGTSSAAAIHLARATCRRAERNLVRLMNSEEEVNPDLLIYLNRLSDLLFVMARYENQAAGRKEEIWQRAP